MLNSIELLSEKRIPAGAELYLPSDTVLYVSSGALIIGDYKLLAGQYMALKKDQAVSFEVENGSELRLLMLSFDSFGENPPVLCDVFDTSCPDDMNGLLAGRELWLPHNTNSAEKMAEYVLSLLVGEEDGESCGNKYVDMAKRYIDFNYHLDIRVEELAERIGVDRKYLRNLFVEYLGVSTKDYIMNLRIERAKELLLSTDIAVNSVAFSVGYSDALGFSKMFKKYTGLSPSDYRGGESPVEIKQAEEPVLQKKEDIKYFLL